MRYTVVLVPEEGETGRYVAYVPAIPGCVTFGTSISDALAMAEDAATGILAVTAEDGGDLSTEPPGAVVDTIAVEVPAPVDAVA